VIAESIRGESFGNVEVRRSARDYVQQGGGCNRANDLRPDVGQDLVSRKTAAACQSHGHRRVEMTSRDMPDAICHGEHGETERQGHTKQAETALRKTGRYHGGPTSAEGQPECSDGFGCELPAVNLHVVLLPVLRERHQRPRHRATE
jgi:hypothetical protein